MENEKLESFFAAFLLISFLGAFAGIGLGIGGVENNTQNKISVARQRYPEGTLVYLKPDSQVVTVVDYDVTGTLENRPEYRNVLWYYVMDNNRKTFKVKEWEVISKKNPLTKTNK